MRHNRVILLGAVTITLLMSVRGSPIQADDQQTDLPPFGSGFVDDAATIKKAELQMTTMIKAGQATTQTTLAGQLERTTCQLELTSSSTRPVVAEKLYADRSRSVLAILISRKHNDHWHARVAATGFVIGESGAAVTNRHVFNKGDEYMFAMTPNGRAYPIKEVLAVNKANDAAIFQMDGEDFAPLPLKSGAPTGTLVRVISHPKSRLYSFSQGHISRRYVRRKTMKKDVNGEVKSVKGPPTRWVSITADYGLGSSGGPVFDRFGNVIGMATLTSAVQTPNKGQPTSTQMVFRDCVPAEVILELIKPPAENDAVEASNEQAVPALMP